MWSWGVYSVALQYSINTPPHRHQQTFAAKQCENQKRDQLYFETDKTKGQSIKRHQEKKRNGRGKEREKKKTALNLQAWLGARGPCSVHTLSPIVGAGDRQTLPILL
jgi:hypothetical protein